jgi:hypothetical protein
MCVVVHTSFTRVPFFFFEVSTDCTVLLRTAEESFLELVSRLGTRFRHTMVAGGFGPYHRLWRGGTQTKRTGAIQTPLATPPALGLGSIHRGGEW